MTFKWRHIGLVPHGGIFSVKRIIMVNMLGRGNSMCDDGELSKVYRKW
jgi:hypothetical protein